MELIAARRHEFGIRLALGAGRGAILRLVLRQGAILVGTGLGLGLALYVIQKTFGVVPIPDGFVVDAYPISIRFFDMLAVMAIVISIGFVASFPAAMRAMKVPVLIHDE